MAFSKLQQYLPTMWYGKPGVVSTLLLPLAVLYGAMVWLRKCMYQHGLLSSYHAPVPVMVVGNLTVGGTGKTPLTIHLVKILQAQGVKVGVVSRGYGRQVDHIQHAKHSPLLVTAQTPVALAGDEPLLLVQQTSVPLAVHAKRSKAIQALLAAHPNTALIISDDGLQHYAMQRQIEWVVVDNHKQFGNGLLLPAGPLREGISKLKETTVVWHGATSSDSKPYTMQLQAANLQYTLSSPGSNVAPAPGSTVYALAGIGNPERFFGTLRGMGYNLIELPMPDHCVYTLAFIQQYRDHPIITTSKDAVKLQTLGIGAWVLPVEAVLSAACYRMLAEQLATVGIAVNLGVQ